MLYQGKFSIVFLCLLTVIHHLVDSFFTDVTLFILEVAVLSTHPGCTNPMARNIFDQDYSEFFPGYLKKTPVVSSLEVLEMMTRQRF